MMKLLSTCFLTAALYGTEAQADTSLPVATPFAGVDKKITYAGASARRPGAPKSQPVTI